MRTSKQARRPGRRCPETLRLCPRCSFLPSCCPQPARRWWGGQPGREGWLRPVSLPTARAPRRSNMGCVDRSLGLWLLGSTTGCLGPCGRALVRTRQPAEQQTPGEPVRGLACLQGVQGPAPDLGWTFSTPADARAPAQPGLSEPPCVWGAPGFHGPRVLEPLNFCQAV